jgi:hypothetical protein
MNRGKNHTGMRPTIRLAVGQLQLAPVAPSSGRKGNLIHTHRYLLAFRINEEYSLALTLARQIRFHSEGVYQSQAGCGEAFMENEKPTNLPRLGEIHDGGRVIAKRFHGGKWEVKIERLFGPLVWIPVESRVL